jgi:hypothetical protein
MIRLHLATYFPALGKAKRLEGCRARVVPSHSAFRKWHLHVIFRTRDNLLVLVRLNHIASRHLVGQYVDHRPFQLLQQLRGP